MALLRVLVAGGLAVLAVSPVHATAAEARGDACASLSSAFAAGFDTGGKMDGSWPGRVRPSRAGGPDDFSLTKGGLRESLRGFELTAAEIADLERNAWTHAFAPYAPECRGVRPAQVVEGGQAMTAEFLRPLFSSNGRIAVAVWSLHSTGRWGHGHFCVARRTGTKWRAKCQDTWTG